MIVKTFLFILFTVYSLLFTVPVYARPCYQAPDGSLICPTLSPAPTPNAIESIFGKIIPPDALKGLLQQDPTGAGAISNFLSRLVALIYVFAAIILIFMLLWGAWDWMTSEGDKEKIQSARNKIINAFIGILLFAVAFAVIRVLGQFTGFTFFVGQ
ncbi:hypothetical protein HYT18_01270 [Candidatus Microgenomates bacterium]|nr:hypothetical protein [Candidatus Microgenomates bacterium]